MLIIRREQMSALTVERRRAFLDALEPRVRAQFPGRCSGLGEPETRARIEASMQAALGFGITRAPDVAKFVYLVFLLGPEFWGEPGRSAELAVLRSPLESGPKIDLLYATVRERPPADDEDEPEDD